MEYRLIGFDDYHRFGNLRGTNRTNLRGSNHAYDGSIEYHVRYLSAIRDGCKPEVAAWACRSMLSPINTSQLTGQQVSGRHLTWLHKLLKEGSGLATKSSHYTADQDRHFGLRM